MLRFVMFLSSRFAHFWAKMQPNESYQIETLDASRLNSSFRNEKRKFNNSSFPPICKQSQKRKIAEEACKLILRVAFIGNVKLAIEIS